MKCIILRLMHNVRPAISPSCYRSEILTFLGKGILFARKSIRLLYFLPWTILLLFQNLPAKAQEGSFHISQWNGSDWEALYHPQFQVQYSTQEFKFKPVDGQVKLRISQTGLPFADIDQVKLVNDSHDLMPEYAVHVGDNQSVLEDILEIDHDVVPAHEKEIEISWQTSEECREATLLLNANEYDALGGPLRFPPRGYVKYEMGYNRGTIVVDGDISETDGTESLYSPFWQPTTGHPDGTTYIYICDDAENVYFSLDITLDNTDDYGEDWAEITIRKSDDTDHVFRIDDFDHTWGKTAFGRTSKVPYKHQTVEFQIPKATVGNEDIDFKLQYYGTGGVGTDLTITKNDNVTSGVPGNALTYTIVAANLGPGNDISVNVTDAFPAALTSVSWTSAALGGATGNTASGSGNINETLSMPPSSSVTYTATCDINPSATGSISNTATISSSLSDINPANNSSLEVTPLTPQADISVTKNDGFSGVSPGGSTTYTIGIINNGPSDDPSVSVTDNFPASLINVTYTSVAWFGASGNTASGSGSLSETLSMPAGSKVYYVVSCDVDGSATGSISNTASATASVTDPAPGNNSATDTDLIVNPEIDVQRPAGTSIPDGGTDWTGNQRAGSVNLQYVVDNTAGIDQLDIKSMVIKPITNVSLASGSCFLPANVPAGETRFPLTVILNIGTGFFSAKLEINSNDANESPYDITINGNGVLPEMNVKQGAVNIPDGGTYDFGTKNHSTQTDVVFTIENTGTQELTLTTPLVLGGANAGQFSIQAQPASPVAIGTGSTTFTVRFSPTAPWVQTATLAIGNNDSNENPYNLTFTGTGISPEMNVKSGSVNFSDGAIVNLGSITRPGWIEYIFTIENTGNQELTLTTPLTLGGANADQFGIPVQPVSPVAVITGSTYFNVRFTPTALGVQTATLAIVNSDPDENPYNLTLKGTCVNAGPTISAIPNQTINEDDSTDWLPFTLTDNDGDPASLLVSAGSDNQDLLPNAEIKFKGTGASRFIRVIPSPDSSGSGTVHVTVRDEVDKSSVSFHVTVLPVNDPPQFVSPLIPIALVQGMTYTIPIALLEPLVTDPDDAFESLIWSIPASAHLSPVITSTTISVTAPTDWTGTETLTVTISDGDLSDSAPLIVIVTATADVTPPAAPTNLTATPGPTYIDLSWDANTEPDMAVYVIFRDPVGNILTEGRIDTVFHPVHTYRDENVPIGTTLTYRVMAVDASGNESDPSDPAWASLSAPDVTPPAAPANLTATPGPTYIDLSWDANTEPDMAAYVIFRDPGGNILAEMRIDTVFHPTTAYRDEDVPVGTNLTYRITAVDASGNESDPSNPADAIIATGIEEHAAVPTDFVLYQNHPNPFNPVTTIFYTLPLKTHVKLEIYDMKGRLVAILENGIQSAGTHSARWDAARSGTGIYLYKIITPEFTAIRKCMLVK